MTGDLFFVNLRKIFAKVKITIVYLHINKHINKITMANYSRQLDKFIESKPYANSAFKETDGRTWVSYYQDADGLIHSSTFNYSIIGSKPVTVDEFKQCMFKDPETKVSFVSSNNN